jgi:hypothetical protein
MDPETKTDHGKNGNRWYDPHKMTLSLFGVVSVMLVAFFGLMWSMARAAEGTNIKQDGRIEVIEKGLDRLEGKIDKLIERQPK